MECLLCVQLLPGFEEDTKGQGPLGNAPAPTQGKRYSGKGDRERLGPWNKQDTPFQTQRDQDVPWVRVPEPPPTTRPLAAGATLRARQE